MDEARYFAALTAAVGLVAVLSNRLTERLKVPVPLLVLVAAAIAVKNPANSTKQPLESPRCSSQSSTQS